MVLRVVEEDVWVVQRVQQKREWARQEILSSLSALSKSSIIVECGWWVPGMCFSLYFVCLNYFILKMIKYSFKQVKKPIWGESSESNLHKGILEGPRTLIKDCRQEWELCGLGQKSDWPFSLLLLKINFGAALDVQENFKDNTKFPYSFPDPTLFPLLLTSYICGVCAFLGVSVKSNSLQSCGL